MTYTLDLAKSRFKFSSSHFTIFSESEAESLHGHNYRVGVKIAFKDTDPKTGLALDFNLIKSPIEKICEELDEKILLPLESPFLQIGEDEEQLEVRFADRFYSFPKEECRLLPVNNICTEQLAKWFWHRLAEQFTEKKKSLKRISVTVAETQGQAVTYSAKLGSS